MAAITMDSHVEALLQQYRELLPALEQLAKDAGAVYHFKRRVLVNTQ